MGKVTHIKVKFTANRSPRKLGEVAELEPKLAQFYFNIGVAVPYDGCEGCKDDNPCEDCSKKASITEDGIVDDDLTIEEKQKRKYTKK